MLIRGTTFFGANAPAQSRNEGDGLCFHKRYYKGQVQLLPVRSLTASGLHSLTHFTNLLIPLSFNYS